MQLRPSVPSAAASVAALSLAAMALGACGGPDPTKDGSPPAPPDVAANFAQPIDAKAADGSWTLKIRDNRLTLSRYGQADVSADAPGAMIQPHEATWVAPLDANQSMTVKIYASVCQYPATTENHSFAAEIDLPNTAPLSGCGDPAGGPKAVAATKAVAKK